ncbi:hypothetical protein CGZ75_03390 [Paenibacillus herberti]|uniref:Uncharacterized protein n=1 Tax=Paenibacillus herberti TaxID=1619309 RepID=A0A229P0Y3_9BACL|nr:hypothetical protein CGZ75_03390 [Paenibacillus herberti]
MRETTDYAFFRVRDQLIYLKIEIFLLALAQSTSLELQGFYLSMLQTYITFLIFQVTMSDISLFGLMHRILLRLLTFMVEKVLVSLVEYAFQSVVTAEQFRVMKIDH